MRPVRTTEKICGRLVRETPFIHSAVKSGSHVLNLVGWLISFINIDALCDSHIANWEIFPRFCPYWSWYPMKNQIVIWNNDPSTFPNETSMRRKRLRGRRAWRDPQPGRFPWLRMLRGKGLLCDETNWMNRKTKLEVKTQSRNLLYLIYILLSSCRCILGSGVETFNSPIVRDSLHTTRPGVLSSCYVDERPQVNAVF